MSRAGVPSPPSVLFDCLLPCPCGSMHNLVGAGMQDAPLAPDQPPPGNYSDAQCVARRPVCVRRDRIHAHSTCHRRRAGVAQPASGASSARLGTRTQPSRPATSALQSAHLTEAPYATLAWCARRRRRRLQYSPHRPVPRICWSSYATISVPSSPPGRTDTASRLPIWRSLRRKVWSSTTRMCSRRSVVQAETAL